MKINIYFESIVYFLFTIYKTTKTRMTKQIYGIYATVPSNKHAQAENTSHVYLFYFLRKIQIKIISA